MDGNQRPEWGRGNYRIQTQVSHPVRNREDGHYYQRTRTIYKFDDGTVTYPQEDIRKSSEPESTRGLVDPEGGWQLAAKLGPDLWPIVGGLNALVTRSVPAVLGVTAGLARRTIKNIGGTQDPSSDKSKGDLAKSIESGFDRYERNAHLPGGLSRGYSQWPGTSEPWDERTLGTDQDPQWVPGPIERGFRKRNDSYVPRDELRPASPLPKMTPQRSGSLDQPMPTGNSRAFLYGNQASLMPGDPNAETPLAQLLRGAANQPGSDADRTAALPASPAPDRAPVRFADPLAALAALARLSAMRDEIG